MAIGGHTSGEATTVFSTQSDPSGAFSLGSVPQGTYRKVFVSSGGGL